MKHMFTWNQTVGNSVLEVAFIPVDSLRQIKKLMAMPNVKESHSAIRRISISACCSECSEIRKYLQQLISPGAKNTALLYLEKTALLTFSGSFRYPSAVPQQACYCHLHSLQKLPRNCKYPAIHARLCQRFSLRKQVGTSCATTHSVTKQNISIENI